MPMTIIAPRLLIVVVLILVMGVWYCCEGLTAAAASPGKGRGAITAPPSSSLDTTETLLYQQARNVRIVEGHAAAQPLYERLLSHPLVSPNVDDDDDDDNDNDDDSKSRRGRRLVDATAATHLAASTKTPKRLLSVGHNVTLSQMQQLRDLLVQSRYTFQRIDKLFLGTPSSSSSQKHLSQQHIYASCPLYLKAAVAGSVLLPDKKKEQDAGNNEKKIDKSSSSSTSLMPVQCLASLFLLGLALPCSTVQKYVAPAQFQLLQDLHLISTTTTTPSLAKPRVFANVQIYPVDLSSSSNAQERTSMYIITDWHPRVLSSTSIGGGGGQGHENDANQQEQGEEEESPVMYIGPDSLALVQHLPVQQDNCYKHILDLCTGSGIQAIACLLRQQRNDESSPGRATCVDVSARALRFTRMNAMLNGIAPDRITLIQGDLLSGKGRVEVSPFNKRANSPETEAEKREEPQQLLDLLRREQEQHAQIDLITANPPFLPVPPAIVDARHGFFSAGGPSGEDVLEQIVRVASTICLATSPPRRNVRLAIVSEFFLRATSRHENDSSVASADLLLQRIQQWWKDNDSNHDHISGAKSRLAGDTTTGTVGAASGLLLTNEYPISATTYADRRADNQEEVAIWLDHLKHEEIGFASPGLLFIQMRQEQQHESDDESSSPLVLQHQTVPRSSQYGSIWTPSNPHAATFTRQALAASLDWCDDNTIMI